MVKHRPSHKNYKIDLSYCIKRLKFISFSNCSSVYIHIYKSTVYYSESERSWKYCIYYSTIHITHEKAEMAAISTKLHRQSHKLSFLLQERSQLTSVAFLLVWRRIEWHFHCLLHNFFILEKFAGNKAHRKCFQWRGKLFPP